MPDLYSNIADIPAETQAMLGDALVLRANDVQMREMRRRYFSWLAIEQGGRGIEIGCGTGEVVRDLLEETRLDQAVGLDPSPVFIERAKTAFGDIRGLSFVDGDARVMQFDDASFDLAVFHTTLCHIPEAEKALAEAFRILRPGGELAVFDADYATTTSAIGPNDPLQVCIDHVVTNIVHDMWLCRSLPERVETAGFQIVRRDVHPYLAKGDAAYFLTLINRGADFMLRDRLINAESCDALKAEAQSRVEQGRFFGFISFHSVIARKPD